jgi:hypothetical protein
VLFGSIALELPRPMPSGLHRSGALFNILPPQVNSSRKLKVNSSRKLKAYRGGDGRSWVRISVRPTVRPVRLSTTPPWVTTPIG